MNTKILLKNRWVVHINSREQPQILQNRSPQKVCPEGHKGREGFGLKHFNPYEEPLPGLD